MKGFRSKFFRKAVRRVVAIVMAVFVIMALLAPVSSFAANATNVTLANNVPFAAMLTMVQDWLSGPVVTIISLFAVLLGLAVGIARQSPLAALSGIAFAVIANVLPGIITTIIGAVV